MTAKDDKNPLYWQIYQYLLDMIEKGKLQPNDRLPSEKELSEQFKVSRITSKKALEMLAEKNLIVRIPGKGSYVTEKKAMSFPNGKEYPLGGKRNSPFMGLIMPNLGDPFGCQLLRSIEQTAHEIGYSLVIRFSRDIPEEEERAIQDLLKIGVCGIIVLPVHGEYYSSLILQLIIDHFPIVFVDRKLRGLAACSVSTDNTAGGQMATDYLIHLGHRSIAFISFPIENTSTIEDRLTGFIHSHAEHGVFIDKNLVLTHLGEKWQPPTSTGAAENVNILREFFQRYPEITAVFASEYGIIEYLEEAIAPLHKHIPEDLSVICFDSPPRVVGSFPYTHIRQQEETMGQYAVTLLHDQITGNVQDIKTILLAPYLIEGLSTQKAR